MIAPSPTYIGGEGRQWDHAKAIVEVAAEESEWEWPFYLHAPGIIVQVDSTPRFVKKKSWQERRTLAEGQFRRALRVPDPDRVRGRGVLLFDDVFTDGRRIREVALRLRRAGATEVSQVPPCSPAIQVPDAPLRKLSRGCPPG